MGFPGIQIQDRTLDNGEFCFSQCTKKSWTARSPGTLLRAPMAATGDPKLVGTLMGHRDTKTTMRYNHPPREQVERIRVVLNSRRSTTQCYS
jgi:hypothetical protein